VPGLADLTPLVLDVMSMIGKQASVQGVAVGSAHMVRYLAAFRATFGRSGGSQASTAVTSASMRNAGLEEDADADLRLGDIR